MELSNLNAAYGLCESLYGITPDESSFEDLALEAWSRIGTKHTRLYRYIGHVKDHMLELPCNADIIESVHVPIPDAKYIGPDSHNYWSESIWVERYIDRWHFNTDPLSQKGKLIRYDEGNGTLYFTHNYPAVMIVYHGIFADEETGMPLVNDKELRAVAAFVAYAHIYKQAIKTMDPNRMKFAQTIKEDWLRACNAARIPEHVSQNDMDAVLDARASWNRKFYGHSFKPTK